MLQHTKAHEEEDTSGMDMEEEPRRWEEMQADCLVNIFRRLALGELTVAVPFVCKSWWRASLDPNCWCRLDFRSLDLGLIPSSSFYRSFTSQYRLDTVPFSSFMRLAVHRSRGSAEDVKFPLCFASPSIQDIDYVSIKSPGLKSLALPDHLAFQLFFASPSIQVIDYLSIKCPGLKSLALPDNLMPEDDLRIPELVGRWRDLEQLEMVTRPSSFLQVIAEIGRNCARFTGLKVVGLIGEEDAEPITRWLPELKHLELRESYLTKDELVVIINGCRKLERLTVENVLWFQADDEVLGLGSRIKRFEYKQADFCRELSDESEDETSSFYDDDGVLPEHKEFLSLCL